MTVKKPLVPMPSVSSYTDRETGKTETRTHLTIHCGDCGGTQWMLVVDEAKMDPVTQVTNMRNPALICLNCAETYMMNVRQKV